jgi:hypothetical protein
MTVKSDAGCGEGKLPVYGRASHSTLSYAGGDVGRGLVQGGDVLVQALAGDGRAGEFDQVEPGGILGRVVHLEAGGQGVGPGCGQVLLEHGIGGGSAFRVHFQQLSSLNNCTRSFRRVTLTGLLK